MSDWKRLYRISHGVTEENNDMFLDNPCHLVTGVVVTPVEKISLKIHFSYLKIIFFFDINSYFFAVCTVVPLESQCFK